MPMTTTRKKLASVSSMVMPVWRKMLPSMVMLMKQDTILEGELNIKSSMMPSRAHNSHKTRKAVKSRMRYTVTFFL